MRWAPRPATASLIVAVGGAALATACTALLWTRFFDWRVGLLGALSFLTMPAFLQVSTQAMSDGLYYLCVVASVLALWAWTRPGDGRARWLVIAGVLAGASWTVRNVGLAMLAATMCFLAVHLLWTRAGAVLRSTAWWLGGVAVCALPLAIRNLLAFGTLNPYVMSPSELTLRDNVSRAGDIAIRDVVALPDALIGAIPGRTIAIALALVLAALAWRVSRVMTKPMLTSFLRRNRLPLMLCVYAGLYVAMVIAARTRYRWGELIDSRHLVQVYWILYLIAGLAVTAACRRLGAGRRATTAVLAAFFATTLLAQGVAQVRWLSRPVNAVDAVAPLVGNEVTRYLATHVGERQIVLSTRADLLRIHANVNARKLPSVAQYYKLQPLTAEELTRMGDSGFLWGIVVEDVRGASRGDYDTLVKSILEHPEAYPQLKRVDVPGPAIVLEYVRAIPATT